MALALFMITWRRLQSQKPKCWEKHIFQISPLIVQPERFFPTLLKLPAQVSTDLLIEINENVFPSRCDLFDQNLYYNVNENEPRGFSDANEVKANPDLIQCF